MLRFFFIEYGAQDEIETSYEEGCNRIQKTFDTILRLVDFPFDPGGGGGGWGKKTVSRCKNTFFLPRSRRLSPRRDGIYMHDSRKLNGSTSDRGHLFNCTKQTVHARWKIHAPSPPPLVSYTKARRASRANWIIGDQTRNPIKSLGKGFILHLYRFNAVACPSHMPPPYNSSRWLQNSAFCRQITGTKTSRSRLKSH